MKGISREEKNCYLKEPQEQQPCNLIFLHKFWELRRRKGEEYGEEEDFVFPKIEREGEGREEKEKERKGKERKGKKGKRIDQKKKPGKTQILVSWGIATFLGINRLGNLSPGAGNKE